MMHETPEDKMFTDMLADYAAPIDDNGFSQRVMEAAPVQKDHSALKALMVGSAALVGGAYAALQLPALERLVFGFSMPKLNIPNMPNIDMVMVSSPYMLAAMGMMTMLCLWLATTFAFGD